MSRAPQLIGNPGIQQQGLHHPGIGVRPFQVVGRTDPQGLPESNAEQIAKLEAALHALLAMELHHLMAAAPSELSELVVAGIGHHKNPATVRPYSLHCREDGRAPGVGNEAGRSTHPDHADGIHSEGRHRSRLGGLAQTADLQQGDGHERICGSAFLGSNPNEPGDSPGPTQQESVGEGWQLLKIRGIPLRIHPTWFIILVVATMAFHGGYAIAMGSTVAPGVLWGMAFATALLLFVSVLLHELGHSLVALAHGVKVRSITLFLLGGVASVEKECATARGALLVAAAGPAVSLMLAFVLISCIHAASHVSPVLGAMVTELGRLNLVLALFNLLPGLPLDGGLILKALVWQATGSQRRGVEVANASGRFLSYLAIGLGTVFLLRGSTGATWLILLGWFGLGAARSQGQMLQMQRALKELRVRDVAGKRFRVLEASTSLRRLSELRLEPSRPALATGDSPGSTADGATESEGPPDWLLVCDRGRWQGVIDDAPLQELPVQRWDSERVGDHLRPLDTLPSIDESAPLWQAALQLEETGSPRLLVLSPAGLPSGTLERPELGAAVLERLGMRLPAKLLATARRQNAYPIGMSLGQVARSMVASGEVSASGSIGTR